MKRKCAIGLLIGLLLCSELLSAQTFKDSIVSMRLKSFLKLTLGWHNGIEWEQRVGEKSSINTLVGIVVAAPVDDISSFDSKSGYIIEPVSYIEYRNYYNLLKRINLKKKIKNNSANFLFGRIGVYYPIKNQNYFNLLFIQGWGMQRMLWKKISVGYHIGLIEHVYYDKPPEGGFNYIRLEPLAEFSFSYIF